MSWQILLSISIFATVFFTIVQKLLMRDEKADPIVFSIVAQIIPGILIFLYAIFTTGFYFPNLLAFPLNSLLMVVVYGAANIFLFNSIGLIDASEYTVIFLTRVVWVVGIAVIFLHEAFPVSHILGSFLIIFSVFLVSWKKKKFSFGRGELYAILGAFCMGIGIGNDGFLSVHFDTLSYLVIAFILPGIALIMVYPKKLSGLRMFFKPEMSLKMLFLCIFYAISAVTYFLAFKLGKNVGQVAILNQISAILTVLFSAALLKETKNINKKIIGAVLAFLGVILLR